jgi:hypothetical protein
MDRRPIKVAAVALANKIARMAVRGERFKEPKLLPAGLAVRGRKVIGIGEGITT